MCCPLCLVGWGLVGCVCESGVARIGEEDWIDVGSRLKHGTKGVPCDLGLGGTNREGGTYYAQPNIWWTRWGRKPVTAGDRTQWR